MGGASSVIGWGFRVHPSLILSPWGDERLRGLQSLSLLLVFSAHYCFVLSKHYLVHREEARLVEARVKFRVHQLFVVHFVWLRLVSRVVTYNWNTISMVTC
jgi:hypothetical protein